VLVSIHCIQVVFLWCCWINCYQFRSPESTLNNFLHSFFIPSSLAHQLTFKSMNNCITKLEAHVYAMHQQCLGDWSVIYYVWQHNVIERYSGCHHFAYMALKKSIEWVLWWECYFHFWARTVQESFWIQDWKTSWSVATSLKIPVAKSRFSVGLATSWLQFWTLLQYVWFKPICSLIWHVILSEKLSRTLKHILESH